MKQPVISQEQMQADLKRLKELAQEPTSQDTHVEADNIIAKYLPEELALVNCEIGRWYA